MDVGSARTALAIALGYILNVVLVTASEQLLTKYLQGTAYFRADIVIQCVIEIAAGYLSSLVARPSARRTATFGLMILGWLIGATFLVLSWGQEPHWYGITLLAVWGPCVWIGYRLQLRLSNAASLSSSGSS
jgi:hypothetical protein